MSKVHGDADRIPAALRSIAVEEERALRENPFLEEHLNSGRGALVSVLTHGQSACVAVTTGRVNDAEGAFRQFVHAVGRAAEEFASHHAELRSERDVLHDRVRTLETERHLLDDELLATQLELDRRVHEERQRADDAIATMERQFVQATTLTDMSDATIVDRLRRFLQSLPDRVTTMLASIAQQEQALEHLIEHELPTIEALETIEQSSGPIGAPRTRSIDEELIEIGGAAAPFLVNQYHIDPSDAANIDRLAQRYTQVTLQFERLADLVTTIQHDRDMIVATVNGCRKEWVELDAILKSALRILPEIFPQDVLTLVGTTRKHITEQQRRFAKTRDSCDHLIGKCNERITGLLGKYDAARTHIDRVHVQINALSEFNTIPWFDARSAEQQRIIQGAVLAFPETGERMSAAKLTQILICAGRVMRADDAEQVVYPLLRPEFFTPAHRDADMQRKMRMFTLTPSATYWRTAWQYRDPVSVTEIDRARRTHESAVADAEVRIEHERNERQRQRADADAKKQRTLAEGRAARELRQQEQRDPGSIARHMTTETRKLLQACVLLAPHLPTTTGNRDYWNIIATVAVAHDHVSRRRHSAVATAMHRLIYGSEPELLRIAPDAAGVSRCMPTELGVRVAQREHAIPDALTESMTQMLRRILQKDWPPETLPYHQQLQHRVGELRRARGDTRRS